MQLYDRDIIDVGAVVNLDLEQFFSICSFGEDSEKSTTMMLSGYGKLNWLENGEALVEEVVRKKRVGRGGKGLGAVATR